VISGKVGSLRRVTNDMSGQQLSQSSSEGDQPLLSSPCLHSRIVLPIDVNSIQIIRFHICSQFVSTINGIEV
jgi:hypothetical protein